MVPHCPRTQGVWDEAIKAEGEDAGGTPAAVKCGGVTRQPKADHLLSPYELADRATEVRLRARGRATKALVSGIALVDAALKVERDPMRARATELAKAKRATARGKAKAAKKASPSPRPNSNPARDGPHTGIRLL